MKRFLCGVSLGLMLAGPVSAEVWGIGEPECNQLWFMRNLLMDRAGYCFGSPLGQALFDNGDCTGTDVTLPQDAARQVKAIQSMERANGCSVNTKARKLKLEPLFMAQLRQLRDMPLPDGGGSACTWDAPPMPLRAGHDAGARVIGEVHAGDRLFFFLQNAGDWIAVAAGEGDNEILGWFDYRPHNPETNCTDWAG